jgi:hypothetical protein
MRLSLTFEGLRDLIRDYRQRGGQPIALLLSEHDKRDLKHELMAHSISHQPEAERSDHDRGVMGFIEGCVVTSHKDVTPGNCRIVDARMAADRNQDVMAR